MGLLFYICREQKQLLLKCAATSLSSKLVAHQKEFFSNMVVDAVMLLDELLPLNMIGIKKVTGGALEVILCGKSWRRKGVFGPDV